MNTAVQPCHNFYEFMCGNFKKWNPLLIGMPGAFMTTSRQVYIDQMVALPFSQMFVEAPSTDDADWPFLCNAGSQRHFLFWTDYTIIWRQVEKTVCKPLDLSGLKLVNEQTIKGFMVCKLVGSLVCTYSLREAKMENERKMHDGGFTPMLRCKTTMKKGEMNQNSVGHVREIEGLFVKTAIVQRKVRV
ncbi:hypothetical protein ACFE04_021539 [Oxalis oulophora]